MLNWPYYGLPSVGGVKSQDQHLHNLQFESLVKRIERMETRLAHMENLISEKPEPTKAEESSTRGDKTLFGLGDLVTVEGSEEPHAVIGVFGVWLRVIPWDGTPRYVLASSVKRYVPEAPSEEPTGDQPAEYDKLEWDRIGVVWWCHCGDNRYIWDESSDYLYLDFSKHRGGHVTKATWDDLLALGLFSTLQEAEKAILEGRV